MRILIIEDDAAIADMIKRGLEDVGYDTDHASDGMTGRAMALENPYGLVVLDVMLPKMDGWQVCAELRRNRNSVPILMLTARGAVEDRVRGLEIGADDYLPKPFAFSEFLARVRAQVRRGRVHRTRIIHVGDLEIDTSRRVVTRGGAEIGLSHREYDLLESLAAQEGRVLTREAIQERVWMNQDAMSSVVDVYIGTLRKKIDAGYEQKLIHTVHGVGYTLRAPDPDASR